VGANAGEFRHGHVAVYGLGREADEGTEAHLFQQRIEHP
jgi:hypothetical protein